ncbi:MAG: hypothetical protein GY832_18365 [Chloroflexi bacterium]|nr:hypothetical protein [Chloroflexota bacterium]
MKISQFFRLVLLFILLTALIGTVNASTTVQAPNAPNAVPGELRSYATIHSIGIEWDITGDADHDAECQVQYRALGANAWKQAVPLFRVDFNDSNMLAGSIFFLEPGTSYQVQLDLSDPDGGSDSQTMTIATRAVPQEPSDGRTLHVVPGTGGGDGSEGDPFQGIDAAQATAQPGDVFLLHAGNYGGRVLFDVSGAAGNYIVWKGAGDGNAILEGVRIDADHIWLEGLTVTAENGLLTYSSPEDVVIHRNTFTDCHYCIWLNHGGENWTITDNLIVGDVSPDSGSFSGEGIELQHSSGHVVAYNSISYVADGVSYPHRNCDIYGNDIFDVSDDGIEPDYGYANVRVWGNRISNAYHNGISFQPMNGAPWYILRNQVAAPVESALKFRDQVDRALIAHNTFVGWQGVQKSGAQYLLSVQSNNNLWISVTDWYAWENGSGGTPDWRTSLDYDGFDWGDNVYAFKWGGSGRYPDLASFTSATGLQPHGIRVDKDTCFETFDVPNAPPASMPLQFMTLDPNCNAVDAGVALANINEDFNGTAPDLGAYEVDAPLPHYGPRPVDEPLALTLTATSANQAIHLKWTVSDDLPPTSTWQIDYRSQSGTLYTPITEISPTRAHTLSGLSNYVWYTVTLNAMLDSTPFLTDTVRAMPTNIFVYLPVVLKGE